jgi:ABC-type transporter Mla MlaB component
MLASYVQSSLIVRGKVGGMLRITIKTTESSQIWELEGRLSGEWVCELNRLWKDRSPQAGLSTEVHLKAVSYIDPAGKQLLAEMRQQGAEIRGCGCMVRAFVEEIMGKKRPTDANGLPKKILTVILFAGFLFGGGAVLCSAHKSHLKLAVQDQTGSRTLNPRASV